MSTNPSVSAASPGPRVPGPPAAERAGPWESQHLCSSRAGGEGWAAGRPPALPQPRRRPPPGLAEAVEWNEWAPASSHAGGNQMIGRKGPPPPPPGPHPPGPPKVERRHWPGQRRVRLYPRGVGSPKPKAQLEEARSRLQGALPEPTAWGGELNGRRRGPSERCPVGATRLGGTVTGHGGGAAIAISQASFYAGSSEEAVLRLRGR